MDFMDFYHVNDRRTHRRFAVAMSARLYHASGRFSLCSTADLSLAGACIHLVSALPEPVTAFGSDETGKLAVAGFHFAQPFVRLAFDASTETRAVIKQALRSLGDRQMVQPLPVRRGERLSTRNVMLTRADGSHLSCDILDMSPQGMLLGGRVHPPVGERVTLGKTAGIVVRHHGGGFAIRILDRNAEPANVVRFPAVYRAPILPSSPHFDGIA
jgi:hypothetical protein